MTHSRLPALFIGHGSPMNALEDNRYTQSWQKLAASINKPKAILVISAHWFTRGTAVTAMDQPKTIHDFGGFPQALFDIRYPAPGDPELVERIKAMLAPIPVILDKTEWGLDHGTWEVLIRMYPDADIPVIQLSMDGIQSNLYHYQLGQKLTKLREEGVLIVGSGNVVHNLRAANWSGQAAPFDWALRFNQFVKDNLNDKRDGEVHALVNYENHPDAQLACPTSEHYLPLLYVLGAWDKQESITVAVEGIEMGSLSMMSVRIG